MRIRIRRATIDGPTTLSLAQAVKRAIYSHLCACGRRASIQLNNREWECERCHRIELRVYGPGSELKPPTRKQGCNYE